MSVLMKALEKAAQDREKASADSSQNRELMLEALEPGHAASGNTANARDNPRSSAQAKAANVLSAHRTSGNNTLAWLRAHPLYLFGGLAGLFLLVYGAYVYVQITHPGWLIRTPPPSPGPAVARAPANPNPATVSGPASASPAAPATGADASNSQLVPLQSVFGGAVSPQISVTTNEPAKDGATLAPTRPAMPAAAAVVPTARAPASGATALPSASSTVAPQLRERVAVSRGDTATPRVNPVVSEAYAALEAGQFDTAQRLYHQVLRSEPSNVDALLGLAAIAQRDNRNDEAQKHFLAILNVEPRHALAQSGLIALMSRADPLAAESRLKQLLAREPSAPLYFNLGNLYAEQGQWAQAQQAYFQAHDLDAKNPDYAYNLAVGLEHLGQQKLALGYYRKALQLASARAAANFDAARIQERITELSARFD